jgi:hypothetical protein
MSLLLLFILLKIPACPVYSHLRITATPASSPLYGEPEINPIFISQGTCECPRNPSCSANVGNCDNGESALDQVDNNDASALSAFVPSPNCRAPSRTRVIQSRSPRSFHYK